MKKIGNSFKGILGGFILIVASVILLWWNEGNNVRNLKTTAEMSKNYIDVSSEKVDTANEGKLVATSGKVINEVELEDLIFGVKVKTPVLKRIVEVYQWEEESETDSDDNTTYTYKKVWSDSLINSDNFNTKTYTNPKVKPYENADYYSENVKVGAFSLSGDQIRMLSTNGTYSDYDTETINKLDYVVSSYYVTNSKDLNNPQIGDVRISFVYNNSTDLSVLAVQRGDSFVDFVSKAEKTVNRVMDGVHSGEEMINIIKKENKIIKWVLRVVGIILCISGIATVLKPLSTITSFVPILGSLVNGAVGLASFLLGLALSLVIIAVAWIRFRPVLGIVLLVIVAVLIFVLISMSKKKQTNPNQNVTSNPNQPQYQDAMMNQNPMNDNNNQNNQTM